jgi:bifunctional non-homologous end joining protein LigD
LGERASQDRAALPNFIPPELATLVENAPEGDAWLHEIKRDGYHTAARTEGGKVWLLTRTGLDWTARFLPISPRASRPASRSWNISTVATTRRRSSRACAER